MERIVITSGPTRQYLDPVRYLTNASSGRMGSCLAEAALVRGHKVIVVSGPVALSYPSGCQVHHVVTTQEMLEVARRAFSHADGLIGVAAPCDYMPKKVADQKISKNGLSLNLELIETPDIVASLAASKRDNQWVVGFALETEDQRFRAVSKMQRKCCDMMVSNGPDAMNSESNQVEILARDGNVLEAIAGSKATIADRIMHWIQTSLIERLPSSGR
jgi:phosphopantothenoylcysteine decarboxylase/phosphopantothenate--cysteine ligase